MMNLTGGQFAMSCLFAAIVGVASEDVSSQTLQGCNTTVLLMAGTVGGALAVSIYKASRAIPSENARKMLIQDGAGFISALISGVIFAPQVYEWLPIVTYMPLRQNNPGALACGGVCGVLGYSIVPAITAISRWRFKQTTGKDLD